MPLIDTALQTPDSKFEHWRSEVEHATSRSRRLHTILNLYEWARKKHFVSLKHEGQSWGSNPRSPTVQENSFNHCNRPPARAAGYEPRTLRMVFFKIKNKIKISLNFSHSQNMNINIISVFIYSKSHKGYPMRHDLLRCPPEDEINNIHTFKTSCLLFWWRFKLRK